MKRNNLETSDARTAPRRPRKLHGCVVAVIVLLVLLLLLLLAGPAVMRLIITRKLPPAELHRLEVFKTKPVHFPARWQKVEPVPEEVVEQGERVLALVDSVRPHELLGDYSITSALGSLQKGENISNDQWTTLGLIAEQYLPIHKEIEQLVKKPGYSFQSLPLESGPDLLQPGIIRKSAAAAAHVASRSGNTSAAIDLLLTMFIMTDDLGAPLTLYDERSLAFTVGGILKDFATHISRSTDTLLLNIVLSELNGRRYSFENHALEIRLAAPYLADLRRYKTDGLNIDIKPGLPGRAYWNQVEDLCLPHAVLKLEKTPITSTERPKLLQEIEGMRSQRLPALIDAYLSDTFVYDGMFLRFWESFDDYDKYRLKNIAFYDVLRLDLGARILQLEGQPVTPYAVYAMLPDEKKPLIDPYSATGKSYQFHPDPPHFFSVGENGMSDHRTSGATFSLDHIGDDVIGLRPLEETTYAVH